MRDQLRQHKKQSANQKSHFGWGFRPAMSLFQVFRYVIVATSSGSSPLSVLHTIQYIYPSLSGLCHRQLFHCAPKYFRLGRLSLLLLLASVIIISFRSYPAPQRPVALVLPTPEKVTFDSFECIMHFLVEFVLCRVCLILWPM